MSFTERAGGLFRSIQKEDQLQCTCSFPSEENFRRSPGCLPDFRERACVLRSGRELPGEKAEPEEKSCSLFSTLDGVIDSMVTRQGTPLVRAGDEIKKGQELVSGIVDITDDSQEVIRYAYVQADADIYIRHTIAYYDTFPLDMEKKVWSDKKKTRLFFQLGNWFLDFSSPLKQNEERLVSREPLFSIGIFRSPVTLGIAAIGKYEVQKEQLTEDAAKKQAIQRLYVYEEKLIEKGVQISENNVKIEIDHKTCVS